MTNRIEKVIIPPDIKLKHWGYGEWVEEPDEVIFYYKDVKCIIRRMAAWEGLNNEHLFGGPLCGYVIVPHNHPWFGKSWDDLSAEAHGGLTYYREEGSDWVIGFDCAHSGDLCPSIEMLNKNYPYTCMNRLRKKFPQSKHLFKVTYRNIAFVEAECKSLVDQMLEVSNYAPRSM